ncbi:Competence protein ComGF [Helicobacter heilmannii]|uniref:Competence protein ComGF n=1 Tax=Helicobacter heilmannii TaxID=35817 RepID=A0A0K2XRD7_HELHE|nr:HD domain-containing protein [Helicobacter heilmannii]CRF45798.1 Competence protein ComGF [Helicobacter heilmannii]CRF47410.1 Competence protein ComGF [Helicobacter heilmannii]CRF49691.1 Competence protein ComGF [Helicobacter heilmannii]CRI34065.1 Competence protein ComGF [Helicobacter heilmannii]
MITPHLNKALLERLFVAASIRRWNDQACPIEFSELDKQAHKAVVVILLAKHHAGVDWDKLLTYFCFEFLSRVVLTDIKPPIYYKLLEKHRADLAAYVWGVLSPEVQGYGIFEHLQDYFCNPPKDLESQLLKAAHDYVSAWEFGFIERFYPEGYGVQEIKAHLDKSLKAHAPLLEKVAHLELLTSMFGQLRFQKRWSQTPRVPPTSVLGHALFVAFCAFLLSFDLKACKQMRLNHFLGGLLHDLPEVLTRDIISPIKHGVKGLDSHLKTLEAEAMQEHIWRYLDANLAKDLRYFTEREFDDRYINPTTKEVQSLESPTALWEGFNEDQFNGVSGRLLKFCDQLSAFLEAKISIAHGIKSDVLVHGAKKIQQKCQSTFLQGVHLGALFGEFA